MKPHIHQQDAERPLDVGDPIRSLRSLIEGRGIVINVQVRDRGLNTIAGISLPERVATASPSDTPAHPYRVPAAPILASSEAESDIHRIGVHAQPVAMRRAALNAAMSICHWVKNATQNFGSEGEKAAQRAQGGAGL